MSGTKIFPVILSGGTGSRLWPLSRALFPKQLLPLTSEKTMLQETVLRAGNADLFAKPIIIANEEHRFIIAEQMRSIGVTPEAIILEPTGRNTAPAVALAALHISKIDPDGLMLIMPSDHIIQNTEAFLTVVKTACKAVSRHGLLATFGIKPEKPETGYGYIQKGSGLKDAAGCFNVKRFVEKPDLATAESYVSADDYYWNSGLFLFSVKSFESELEKFAPEILAACTKAMAEQTSDLSFIRPNAEAFKACPADSIDYAVMEHTSLAAVVPVDMGWNDVGSWAALWEVGHKDEQGNVITGDVINIGTRNALLRSQGPVIAAVGLNDVIVVATKDAVLVADKKHAQDVKKVVDALAASGRTEHISHTVVFRPWGNYQTTDEGERFQVKRLVVNPGEKLSLQKHHHRAEHWVVVQGTAHVTRDDELLVLHENESVYIPIGAKHRLENPGKIPLHIVEVQSGGYLGEDDIVRFDDTYGRK
jgi:mannose-1-phosphate guanylyltransferase/mannose-6-phosphate isomerase